jgi:hypothetical protein
MKKIILSICFFTLWFSGTAWADGFGFSDVYYGAGVSSNETEIFDDATGYQVFAGYEFDRKLGPLTMGVEAGYMDSGEFERTYNTNRGEVRLATEAKGGWVSGHLAHAFTDAFGVIGRAGYDFGDDDGALLGVGGEYRFLDGFALRAEYIARDVTDSLQLNLVYRLNP